MSTEPTTLSPLKRQSEPSFVNATRPTRNVNWNTGVQIIDADQIDDSLYRFWLGLHQTDSQLLSPNFHPEFTKAVAAVRDDVKIAVIRYTSGELAGVFPYQISDDMSANPVGGRMNDYHGVMLAPGVPLNLHALLDALNIKRFSFHAIAANRKELEQYQFTTLPSFSIDISEGADLYLQQARRSSRTLRELPRKSRGLVRDHAPVRIEHSCDEAEVFEKLLELKSGKYVSTNTFDILSVEWAANMLRQIHGQKKSGFRSMMSVLWANDSIAAAHFGMASGEVMQYWFPVFNPEFSKYSPGLQLMTDLIEHAYDSGIRRIDLSYGPSRFKTMFSNTEQSVLFGQVNQNPLAFQLAKQKYRLRVKLKEIPLKKKLKYFLRQIYPAYGSWHFK